MDDAVRERDRHCRIRYKYVGIRATLHSTRGNQGARAYFDLKLSIVLRRSGNDW